MNRPPLHEESIARLGSWLPGLPWRRSRRIIPSGAIAPEVTEMGWDRGRYYTRSTKVNGRVQREYFGCGPAAEAAAAIDADRRALRAEQAAARKEEQAALAARRAQLDA